jgi:hypothetical protein
MAELVRDIVYQESEFAGSKNRREKKFKYKTDLVLDPEIHGMSRFAGTEKRETDPGRAPYSSFMRWLRVLCLLQSCFYCGTGYR